MKKTQKWTRAIIYARGVPDATERQLQACREYAAKYGLTVAAEIAELKSALGVRVSPSAKLLEQVDAQHPDVVIVTDLDRLSRRFREVADVCRVLAERNVRIVTTQARERGGCARVSFDGLASFMYTRHHPAPTSRCRSVNK